MLGQTETDGAFARGLYAGLEETEAVQDRFLCWLDQFDLQVHPTEDPNETRLKALRKSKVGCLHAWHGSHHHKAAQVYLPILSEAAIQNMNNPALGSWLATELATAMQLHKAKKIDIIPICIGAMLKLHHPAKPHKTFDVFDSFDRDSTEDISEHLVRGVDEVRRQHGTCINLL